MRSQIDKVAISSPPSYGGAEHAPADATLEELPFGSTVSHNLLRWLRDLPVSTDGAEAYLGSHWRTLSWTTLHVFMSDVISQAEHGVGMNNHSERVSLTALQCGVALGIQPGELSQLYWGGALHDIGKLAMNQAVLAKPSPLTAYEWQLVRQHPVWGHEVLTQVLRSESVAEIALTHHEHWGGGGYPNGLCGEDIPLNGRIVAVADTFDAITSPRPYKKVASVDTAIKIIAGEAGHMFDPVLVKHFLDSDVLYRAGLRTEVPDVG